MRAFLLSLDATVASGLFILLTVVIAGFYVSFSNNELQVKQAYYTAKDINNILFETNMTSLRDMPLIQDLLNNGTITEEDLNLTFIELVGYWWARGNDSFATNLTEDLMSQITNHSKLGYEILFENTTIYAKDSPTDNSSLFLKTKSVITGIELGKEPEGFVAAAFAKSIEKNTTMVLPFGPEGGARWTGKLYLTKRFYLNSSEVLDLYNATFYIATHLGLFAGWTDKVTINGNQYDSGDFVTDYSELKDGAWLIVGHADIDTSDFVMDGWNTIQAEISSFVGSPSHTHPGTRLEIEFLKNESMYKSNLVDESLYFDNVLSTERLWFGSGAWEIFPFYVPEGVNFTDNTTNITLHVYGESLDNEAGEDNIQIYLNNQTLYIGDPAGDDVDFSRSFDITFNATHGTNAVAVYFNCYGESYWGSDDTIIFSDPQTAPTTSSRVDIKYLKPDTKKKSGHIEVGVIESLGGADENPKTFVKNFSGYEVSKAFLHLTTLDNEYTTLNVSNNGQNYTVFSAQQQFATPTTIYIDPDYLIFNGNNTFNITDSCSYGDLCRATEQSSLEYFLWLRHLVGYGEVFPNATAATEDAIQRLSDLLSGYADIGVVDNDTISIPEIPSLWGPARMEVRVWS